MGLILILDEPTRNKIAAGEVVERPASVVKELIENSLDAGATRIEIEIEEGGKGLIRVSDNGTGMSPEDAYLAVQPHATSKIASAEDLTCITSFGFRGEALPSIAAVSYFLLTTRTSDSNIGTSVAIEGGKLLEVAEVGCPPGTQVTVRRLFYNVPARFKYLKSNATELSRIVDVVSRLSLAHPNVYFSLVHGGDQLLVALPTDNGRARLADVFGADAAREMLEVHHETDFVRVFGHVSRPAVSRSDRARVCFFANARPIHSPMLNHALERAYETLLPAGRHPLAALFVQIEPRLIDPNVHPTKREVRFTREGEVYGAVYAGVRDALASAEVLTEATEGPQYLLPARPETVPAAPPSDDRLQAFRDALQERIRESAGVVPGSSAPAGTAEPRDGQVAPRKRLRTLGQVRNAYILVEAEGNLLIVDQHAAHERVLYERNMEALLEKPAESQGLLTPLTIELSPAEARVAFDSLELLSRLGYQAEPFGANTLLVRGVPPILGDHDPRPALCELIEAVAGQGEFGSIPDPKQRLAASLACQAAVKAGDTLAPQEMDALINALFAAKMRFTCPHSRPVFVTLTPEQLERQFRRR